jgi:uncharacterized protein (TIGR03000 family)
MKHCSLFRCVVPVFALIALLTQQSSLATAGPRVGGHNPPIGGGTGGGSPSYYPPPVFVTPAPTINPAVDAAAPANGSPNIRFYLASPTDNPTAAYIAVRLPANAEIWFDGDKTTQTGSDRLFVTPPLSPDRDYTYKVRVQWSEDGRKVERMHSVAIRAGDRASLDFVSANVATGPR